MAAPRRYRNMRVSVRDKAETIDATWRTPNKTWAETRKQRVTLHPISATESLALDRQGRAADWRVLPFHARPAIVPGQRIVVFQSDGKTVQMILDVLHVQERGARSEVLCKETSEVQS